MSEIRRTAVQELLLDLAEQADNEAWTRARVTKVLRLLSVMRITSVRDVLAVERRTRRRK